jgi:hypothetical protein
MTRSLCLANVGASMAGRGGQCLFRNWIGGSG